MKFQASYWVGRVKLIPFERHFEENEQDKGPKTFFKKTESISGIFNWFVKGLKLMQTEGLEAPTAVKNAIDEYREESDTIGIFIKECLEPCNGEKIKTKNIYAAYNNWCNDCGYNPKNQANLLEELRKKEIVKRDKKLGNIVFDYIIKKEEPDYPFTKMK